MRAKAWHFSNLSPVGLWWCFISKTAPLDSLKLGAGIPIAGPEGMESHPALRALPCSTVCSATIATSATGGKPLPLGWHLQQQTTPFRHASSLCPPLPLAACCLFSPLSIFVRTWEIISMCTLTWTLPVGSTCLFSLCCCDALLLHAGHRWGTTFPAFPALSNLTSHPTMRELLIWKLVQGWTGRCADSRLLPSSVSLFYGWSQHRINPRGWKKKSCMQQEAVGKVKTKCSLRSQTWCNIMPIMTGRMTSCQR